MSHGSVYVVDWGMFESSYRSALSKPNKLRISTVKTCRTPVSLFSALCNCTVPHNVLLVFLLAFLELGLQKSCVHSRKHSQDLMHVLWHLGSVSAALPQQLSTAQPSHLSISKNASPEMLLSDPE